MKIRTVKQAIEYFEKIGCLVQVARDQNERRYSVCRNSLTRRHVATFKSAARLVAAAEKSRSGVTLTTDDADDEVSIPEGSTRSIGDKPLWIVWKGKDGAPADPDDDDDEIHHADIVDERGVTVIGLMHREYGWTGFLDREHPRGDEAIKFAKLVFGETLESIR